MAAHPPLEISSVTYNKFAYFILKSSALDFTNHFQQDLVSSISERIHILGIDSPENYYHIIRKDNDEYQNLVQLLTIGETYFFRYPQQFDMLRMQLFPQLKKDYLNKNQPIHIWSTACSTGEEPYSLVMIANELFPGIKEKIKIWASDIDGGALAKAKQGVYRPNSFRTEEHHFQENYFVPHREKFVLAPSIIEQVDLYQLNLLELEASPMALQKFHIIFCRNVLIYFKDNVIKKLIEQFYHLLLEGGYLFLGPTEKLPYSTISASMKSLGHSVYQKSSVPLSPSHKLSKIKSLPSKSVRKEVDLSSLKARLAKGVSKPHTSPQADQDGWLQGQQAYQNKDFPKAQKSLSLYLEQHPQHLDARLLLAHTHADLGQIQEAQKQCERIVEQDSLFDAAYFLKGMLYQNQHQPKAAESMFRKCIYCNEKNYLAHYFLGELLEGQGNQQKAIKEYRNVVRILEKYDSSTSETLWEHPFSQQSILESCLKKIHHR